MNKVFEAKRFELLTTDRIHIADHAFGHNLRGDFDVWIDSGAAGKAFVRQLTVRGHKYGVHQGVYNQECYFLLERATGRYFFLEMDARGFYLGSDRFFGADGFLGAEAVKITEWLARARPVRPAEPARRRERPQPAHTARRPDGDESVL